MLSAHNEPLSPSQPSFHNSATRKSRLPRSSSVIMSEQDFLPTLENMFVKLLQTLVFLYQSSHQLTNLPAKNPWYLQHDFVLWSCAHLIHSGVMSQMSHRCSVISGEDVIFHIFNPQVSAGHLVFFPRSRSFMSGEHILRNIQRNVKGCQYSHHPRNFVHPRSLI